MTTAAAPMPSGFGITHALFARTREVDGWPTLRGGQEIAYPARRNRTGRGYLSATLCKACVVALKGDVVRMAVLEAPEGVLLRSRSQSSATVHDCLLTGGEIYLPRGKLTYHLGLLFLAEALAHPADAGDLLDALEETLTYSGGRPGHGARYDELLAHLSDELYYWARYRDGDPDPSADRLRAMRIRDAAGIKDAATAWDIEPLALSDPEALRALRLEANLGRPTTTAIATATGSRFRGPQLAELVDSLRLGMDTLLVGPTATGKSLCAMEAFDRAAPEKPVHVIEGHESLRELDLLGGYTPDSGGGFTWRDGMLTRAMREGGFLFVDEANRMPARALNVLLGVLSRGAVVLAEHGSEEVRASDGFIAVLAMNLGQGYLVNSLDRALLDRFPCVLEFRYLSPREEEGLLVAETGIDRHVAGVMVKVAAETRRLRRNRELSGELTPRGLFAWARKMARRRGRLVDVLQDAASVTWLHSVAGTDADGYMREDSAGTLLALIEAHAGS